MGTQLSWHTLSPTRGVRGLHKQRVITSNKYAFTNQGCSGPSQTKSHHVKQVHFHQPGVFGAFTNKESSRQTSTLSPTRGVRGLHKQRVIMSNKYAFTNQGCSGPSQTKSHHVKQVHFHQPGVFGAFTNKESSRQTSTLSPTRGVRGLHKQRVITSNKYTFTNQGCSGPSQTKSHHVKQVHFHQPGVFGAFTNKESSRQTSTLSPTRGVRGLHKQRVITSNKYTFTNQGCSGPSQTKSHHVKQVHFHQPGVFGAFTNKESSRQTSTLSPTRGVRGLHKQRVIMSNKYTFTNQGCSGPSQTKSHHVKQVHFHQPGVFGAFTNKESSRQTSTLSPTRGVRGLHKQRVIMSNKYTFTNQGCSGPSQTKSHHVKQVHFHQPGVFGAFTNKESSRQTSTLSPTRGVRGLHKQRVITSNKYTFTNQGCSGPSQTKSHHVKQVHFHQPGVFGAFTNKESSRQTSTLSPTRGVRGLHKQRVITSNKYAFTNQGCSGPSQTKSHHVKQVHFHQPGVFGAFTNKESSRQTSTLSPTRGVRGLHKQRVITSNKYTFTNQGCSGPSQTKSHHVKQVHFHQPGVFGAFTNKESSCQTSTLLPTRAVRGLHKQRVITSNKYTFTNQRCSGPSQTKSHHVKQVHFHQPGVFGAFTNKESSRQTSTLSPTRGVRGLHKQRVIMSNKYAFTNQGCSGPSQTKSHHVKQVHFHQPGVFGAFTNKESSRQTSTLSPTRGVRGLHKQRVITSNKYTFTNQGCSGPSQTKSHHVKQVHFHQPGVFGAFTNKESSRQTSTLSPTRGVRGLHKQRVIMSNKYTFTNQGCSGPSQTKSHHVKQVHFHQPGVFGAFTNKESSCQTSTLSPTRGVRGPSQTKSHHVKQVHFHQPGVFGAFTNKESSCQTSTLSPTRGVRGLHKQRVITSNKYTFTNQGCSGPSQTKSHHVKQVHFHQPGVFGAFTNKESSRQTSTLSPTRGVRGLHKQRVIMSNKYAFTNQGCSGPSQTKSHHVKQVHFHQPGVFGAFTNKESSRQTSTLSPTRGVRGLHKQRVITSNKYAFTNQGCSGPSQTKSHHVKQVHFHQPGVFGAFTNKESSCQTSTLSPTRGVRGLHKQRVITSNKYTFTNQGCSGPSQTKSHHVKQVHFHQPGVFGAFTNKESSRQTSTLSPTRGVRGLHKQRVIMSNKYAFTNQGCSGPSQTKDLFQYKCHSLLWMFSLYQYKS